MLPLAPSRFPRAWLAGVDAAALGEALEQQPLLLRLAAVALDEPKLGAAVAAVNAEDLDVDRAAIHEHDRDVLPAGAGWRREGSGCVGLDCHVTSELPSEWLEEAGGASNPLRNP